MPREFDTRRDSMGGAFAADRRADVAAGAVAAPDRPEGASFDAGAAGTGTYVERATAHLEAMAPALGLRTGAEPSYRVDPAVITTSSGAAAVHARQQHQGILVFQAAEVVRFTPAGSIESTAGQSVAIDRDPSSTPMLGSVEATVAAAQFVAAPDRDEASATDQFGEPMNAAAVDLSGFSPKIVSEEGGPDRRTYLGGEPLPGTTLAFLVWFPIGSDLRLAWNVTLTLPTTEKWRVLVDARDGAVLYSHCLTLYVAARGNVFLPDGGSARKMLDMARPLNTYGLPIPAGLPAGFPQDWVSADRTEGNGANAHLGESGGSIGGSIVNGVLTFNPADPTGDDQKVLNIFFLCNYMHDYLYLLGFREANGNFQQDNFGLGGVASDRPDARSHPGAVNGTANWSHDAADGQTPVTNMGLVTSTNRHTAFDSSVVFHEYTHGLTNALVGGAANTSSLDALQSGSMGEGWGDYIACTINNTVVVGAWVVNSAAGIRAFPYDTNFPDHYGKLGTGRYNEVHNNGEIWCAALMEMNRRIGPTLAVQCVVDGLKLTPGNPTYLQARDGIIAALNHKAIVEKWSASVRRNRLRGAWVAFARFGMGVHAESGPSFNTAGIVADFSVPAELDTVGPWAADFVGSKNAEVLFNNVGDGGWWLGTFNAASQMQLNSVANTLGFGDLGDGAHLAWTGDFTGSGKKQILFNYVGDGNWWLGTMNGGQLSFTKVGNTLGFGDLTDGSHLSWAGDFIGSGKFGVLFNYVGDGNWWLGTMTGGQLLFAKVGNTAGFGNLADGKHPAWLGDFTRVGRAQVLFNYVGDGNWWLGTLSGGQLSFVSIGNSIGFGDLADGKHPSWIGDFTGSGNAQVLFNYVGDGNWWLGSVAGGKLTFAAVGNTIGFGDLADGVHPSWAADFVGAGRTQVLFNYFGDGNWWIGSIANGRIAFIRAGVTNSLAAGLQDTTAEVARYQEQVMFLKAELDRHRPSVEQDQDALVPVPSTTSRRY